jgi:hypothetical protein
VNVTSINDEILRTVNLSNESGLVCLISIAKDPNVSNELTAEQIEQLQGLEPKNFKEIREQTQTPLLVPRVALHSLAWLDVYEVRKRLGMDTPLTSEGVVRQIIEGNQAYIDMAINCINTRSELVRCYGGLSHEDFSRCRGLTRRNFLGAIECGFPIFRLRFTTSALLGGGSLCASARLYELMKSFG